MDLQPTIPGVTVHPEKVDDFEDWIAQVKFMAIDSSSETKRVIADSVGQTVAVDNAHVFVQNALKLFAYSQCDAFQNRICWGACQGVHIDLLIQAIHEGPEPSLLNKAFTCYGEKLICGVIESKINRPD